MKTLDFYHQKRRDGGVRTGVDINGERVMELFSPGRTPPDSALEWFVDVRWRGRNLPDDPEAIRQWLLEQTAKIQTELERMVDDLRAGMDTDWPLTRDVCLGSSGINAKIVCSAIRRLTGRDIGKILLDVKKAWPRLVASLPACDVKLAA